MKTAFKLLRDYWYVPVFAAGVILFWVLTGGKKAPPVSTVKLELDAIRAGSKTRETQLRLSKEQVASDLRIEHASAIASLDEKQTKKAKKLESNPIALSKFLVRSGSAGT